MNSWIQVFAAIGACALKLWELLKLATDAKALTDVEVETRLKRIDACYDRDAAEVRRIIRGS